MPSFNLLLRKQQHQPAPSFVCCNCGCHFEQENNTSNSIIKSPTRWFPRIRRRSSSSSSLSFYDSLSANSPRESNEYHINVEEEKQIEEFGEMYKFAVDEMEYAIESQGSIYYKGDLLATIEAVDACLKRFQSLMQTLQSDRSHQFQEKWTDILFDLRSRLDALPFASENY
ncbi:uncharacterized protein B0P05DRAFT_517208 [Gilbertella persicaria]|uniref:uncharacterized protein n=1 Tax=Gilbertella persicaria TaxID=101096 RepID=UPI0022207342|nr:uncharacterized protein B0P05DRAFT_517208 [Gilbertella persicaria]KAI8059083.1 hypothetical protein B0P05DRAFT_517208 [Gilbertella persicaria]